MDRTANFGSEFRKTMPRRVVILHEDNHVLALDKPAGLPTMGVSADRASLLADAKAFLKERDRKPGNVYLGAMSRLDAPVSGVILFAKTSKAASRLTEQFRERTVDKIYWALVVGRIVPATGSLSDWIRKDERHRRMHAASAEAPFAQEARLAYRTLKEAGKWSLLGIELETGRKHQIRLQLAERGYPIVGDRKYGSRESFPDGIGLHARRIEFMHPVRQERIVVESPLPSGWRFTGLLDHDSK